MKSEFRNITTVSVAGLSRADKAAQPGDLSESISFIFRTVANYLLKKNTRSWQYPVRKEISVAVNSADAHRKTHRVGELAEVRLSKMVDWVAMVSMVADHYWYV